MKLNQAELDLAADVIWWLKGRISVGDDLDLTENHVRVLADIRSHFLDKLRKEAELP